MKDLPGGPTKDEIMAVSLQKLQLRPGDIFTDLGCGTGKIAIAASITAAEVHASDLREDAIIYAKMEARKAGAMNISFFHGDSVDLLQSIDKVDVSFVGGSKHLGEVLTLLAGKGTRNIVVNAVLTDTLNEAISVMRELGIFREALLVQVSRSHEVAGSIMFRPIDPVFIVVGGAA
ncbi:MAG: methyltransferase domain-containing protein [Methanoregulaceae archaeon]|nr:methyltransferase domain-containing protein [Methanoregulaceae archaeon]